ncbi:MAG TPA: metallophosphoesterase [Steroidobacteraceae bacterium]|nr:metallophosphoesterase [Steroidobacteraceae bacterium]
MRIALAIVSVLLMSAGLAGAFPASPARASTTFNVPDRDLSDPLVLVAYGDMRFTNRAESAATNPGARQALVAKIAAENPAAIFINGDLTWHGIESDYAVFRAETRSWRERHLRVYPALGNHEFSACLESACLRRWWDAFPALRGRRWYSVAIGSKVVSIELDTDTSLLPGSAQRIWLENQVAGLDASVRLVLIVMHHPPVADVQSTKLTDHNPRSNERSLAEYLKNVAPQSAARFVVSAGHVHNYERFAEDGVVYLVSGGGGAAPYEVDRTPADLYRSGDFPNYHYVRFEFQGDRVVGEMMRLADYAAPAPKQWRTQDRFEITLRP